MKAIIGGALVALGLAGVAAAQEQEQFTRFARIGGRFVTLQTVAQDDSEPTSAFRFIRVRAEETTSADEPVPGRIATAPAKLRQTMGTQASRVAPQPPPAKPGPAG